MGFHARPSTSPVTAGIVLIQEWWGVNDQIKGVANKLVGAGYEVLIPDLYRGHATLERAEAAHLMDNLDFGDAAGQDVRGAAMHLQLSNRKVAAMGFCMGGAVTILALSRAPELDAGVSWYGMPPLQGLDLDAIKAPFLAHWALDDASFPIEGVDELERALDAAGKEYESHRYEAQHAFANENNRQYDAPQAALAWARSMEFLKRHLQ